MKRTLLFVACVLASLAMPAQEELAVEDIQNSGCLNETQEEMSQSLPTIVLTKEGSVLSVQLLNYETYNATTDFNVTSCISDDEPCSVTINVAPVIPEGAQVSIKEWVCLFNVSFMVRDLEPNRFYLDCWWYKGLVELTEGEPMVLEYKVEDVTIDGIGFNLLQVMHKAMLVDWTTTAEELHIPSEVNYKGEAYTVMSISKDAFWNVEYATKVTIPKTVRSMDLDYDSAIIANPFLECKSLEWIEVEDGCPLFSSADGVLFAEDKTMLLGYPIASPRETYTVPKGVTYIRSGALAHNKYLRKLVIPEEVTYLGWHLFDDTKSLQELYIKGVIDAKCMSDLFGGMDKKVAVYVQPSEVEKYKAIYNGPVYSLPEAQDDSDYLPFVKEGKTWHMVVSKGDECKTSEYMLMNGEVEKNGKTYFSLYYKDGEVVHDLGLLREEDRKVYFLAPYKQEEFLLFDYSMKEGDTFETYSYDEQKMVSYKVVSVGDCLAGPEIVSYDEAADSMIIHRRYLRQWTVRRIDIDDPFDKTWIEGIGSFEGPLDNLYDARPISSIAYLAYVDGGYGDLYLPFSFRDMMWKQAYGCDLPKGEAVYSENDRHHHLTYELEGDRLHVYGEVYTQCGPNNYAYFIIDPDIEFYDDSSMRKFNFIIQEVEPLADCMGLYATDFYVEGFPSEFDYIIVDNQGEEHSVINKASQIAYRPMIEEGKAWKVGAEGSGNPVQWVEYFYFDGDTIIDGRTCKQMMRQRYIGTDFPEYDFYSQQPSLDYVGAWYEEDKKVYEYDTTSKQFKLMYDFSVESNVTRQFNNRIYIVGARQTGGMKGFKGVYRDVWMYSNSGNNVRSTPWLEGVGGIYGPTINVIDGELEDPASFLMSCTVGDEVIYFNDEYEDGTTPEEARKRIDFTHTIKTKPKAPRKREKSDARISSSEREVPRPEVKAPRNEGEETMQTLYGEYSSLKLDINLNPLDDAYQVRITDETGKAVYEKNVNAASIVGLNIDISAYAAGRYTVTVENSSESFTGIFETVTTGIEEIQAGTEACSGWHEACPYTGIYNLQGQRISSLQKGLNIVNGQKVIVQKSIK